jgi:hypothetical protein
MRLLWRERGIALAFVVGTLLRLYQLGAQILCEDEWHPIHSVLGLGYRDIFSHFGSADVSIPLTLLDKAAADTVGLSEWILRAPVLAFALGSLVVFPLLVRRYHGRAVGTAMAWLLAIWPIHVYYSRIARPYAISLFCAFVGVLAFHSWWTTRRRAWGLVYAACAILGPYFHLSAAPVLWAPLGMALAYRMVRRDGPAPFGLLALVGAGLALVFAAPLVGDLHSLGMKVGRSLPTLAGSREAALMLVGSWNAWMLAATAVLALAGAFLFWRRSPGLALFLAALLAAQELVIAIARPHGVEDSIVLLRYSLFVVPLMLWAIALALAALGEPLARRSGPAGVLPLVLGCAAAVHFGPMAAVYGFPNNWTSHGFDPRQSRTEPSRFYFQLAAQPRGSLNLVEAPWYFFSGSDPFYYYQRLHRQNMAIGFLDGTRLGEVPMNDRRFRLQNFVHVLDQDGLCRRHIDRVIFHRDLDAEKYPDHGPRPPLQVGPFVEIYRQRYGAPVFEDERLLVFDPSKPCRRNRL